MLFAHIAGIPVEETVLYVLPLAGLWLIGLKMKFKKCCKCCKRGGSCNCGSISQD